MYHKSINTRNENIQMFIMYEIYFVIFLSDGVSISDSIVLNLYTN